MKYFRWFAQYWFRHKFKMIGLVFLTIITLAAKISLPLFLKFIIDGMDQKIDVNDLYHLVYLFAGFIVLETFLRFCLPFCRGSLNHFFGAIIRNDYYKVFTERDSIFFKKFKTGDLLTRLTDDIDGQWVRIFWYVSSGILRPIEATITLCLTLSIMLYYSWPLTIAVFLPMPFLAYALAKSEHRLMQYTEDKQKAASATNSILESCFSGIRVIKTTISESSQSSYYCHSMDDRVIKEKRFLKINQLVHFLAMFVNHIGGVIAIWLGSFLLIKGHITLGTLTLFLAYSNRLWEPIITLSWFYASTKQIFKYVERLMETEDQPRFPEISSSDHDLELHFDQLCFKNISFKYHDGTENVLSDLTFEINHSEILALTGAVASGKSTVVKLLSRSIRPSNGQILLNNRPIDSYPSQFLSDVIGYVPQTNLLFSETIRKNLELGDKFTDQEIKKALKASMIYDEVESFPQGIDTPVEEKGLSLSGGQKQRLCIARALIRNPKLLILDDCTAAMDAKTEAEFWIRLKEYYPELSILVTTHRLATEAIANRSLEIS